MRIALETSFRFIGRGGVTRYINELEAALPRIAPDLELVDIACKIPNFAFKQPRRAAITAFREFIWTPWIAPRLIRRARPDVLHLTCFPDLPRPRDLPCVVTLHDLSHLRYPGNYRPYTRWRWKSLFARMQDAHAVITVSAFTKKEAIELLDLSPEKIHVVPLAPATFPDGVEASEIAAVLPPRFFLFVGSLAPNKNLALLTQTYALARERDRPLPPLVVVGIRIDGVTVELPMPTDWVYVERVSDQQLGDLYRKTTALLYPSIYEGFGLPIVEAMAAGCPVVCSPVASLPEAGGPAACYADLCPESYLDALVRLTDDPAYRENRITAGKSHAASFTWDDTAAKTLAVYRAIVPR